MSSSRRSRIRHLVLVLAVGGAATACEPEERTVDVGIDVGGARAPLPAAADHRTGAVGEAAQATAQPSGVSAVHAPGQTGAASAGAGGGAGKASDASAASAASNAGAASSADVGAPCGTARSGPCPLQGWMRGAFERASHLEDFEKLEGAFARLAALAPPGFDGWAGFADAGRKAAHERDGARMDQMCKACHAAFREQYRRSPLRSAPLR